MQPGFAKSKAKKNKKQKAKKNKQKKKVDGDQMMADAATTAEQAVAMAADDDGAPGSGKQRHRAAMQLKQALKVKVKGMKTSRNKATKLQKGGKRRPSSAPEQAMVCGCWAR